MIRLLVAPILALVMVGVVLAETDQQLAEAGALLSAGDEARAFKAFVDLAEAGDHAAQRQVAEMLSNGTGTKPDAIDAYAWSALAAESGDADMQAYSQSLLAGLDAKDADKAQRAADKLVGRYGKEAQAEKALAAERSRARRENCTTGSRTGC